MMYPPPDPCLPSPCGPHSSCRSEGGRAVCACEPGTLGAPPSCRPQCVINQDCPLALACLAGSCVNPCAGSCGFNARCVVQNHRPLCSCDEGYSGDPFAGCNPLESKCRLSFVLLVYTLGVSCCLHVSCSIVLIACLYIHRTFSTQRYTKSSVQSVALRTECYMQ